MENRGQRANFWGSEQDGKLKHLVRTGKISASRGADRQYCIDVTNKYFSDFINEKSIDNAVRRMKKKLGDIALDIEITGQRGKACCVAYVSPNPLIYCLTLLQPLLLPTIPQLHHHPTAAKNNNLPPTPTILNDLTTTKTKTTKIHSQWILIVLNLPPRSLVLGSSHRHRIL